MLCVCIDLEMFLSVLGVVVGLLSVKFAKDAAEFSRESANLAKEALERQKKEDELSRPCIGESHWVVYKSGAVFCKLTIFPGRHFVQTRSISIPGYKLSYVRELFPKGKRELQSLVDNLDILPLGKSIPVNGPPVEIEFAVSPVPKPPFTVKVSLASGEPDLVHKVVTPLPEPDSI